ncbi:hypothetical protein RB614_23460 [Phytohabitans sp. ZYX-F-186]|uniref:Uncharacterized protein n=1 Tax=Phytohabitans maris TaxID=3071409 RepID=A0ABU0ZK96_9ACTN|nr:hypothetical protein [Phytohabitans sp. ZYX-F-186]MDQ7907481.1 hypothetical protein [Phytohabitans sp. ZYX-F-186]
MIPSVDRHLEAIRERLAETIFPMLPPEAEFAREQASFVLMALDLVRAAHPHAYRYEVVERHEYAAAVGDLLALGVSPGAEAEARDALAAPEPRADEASIPLAALIEGNRALKTVVTRLFEALCAEGGETADSAREVLRRLAVRQVARERALFASTGYTRSETSLAETLAQPGAAS